MPYTPEIRRLTMIDKAFWLKIAENWRKKDDGIGAIPDTTGDGDDAKNIDPDEIPFDQISDDEIDDILSDLELDEI